MIPERQGALQLLERERADADLGAAGRDETPPRTGGELGATDVITVEAIARLDAVFGLFPRPPAQGQLRAEHPRRVVARVGGAGTRIERSQMQVT